MKKTPLHTLTRWLGVLSLASVLQAGKGDPVLDQGGQSSMPIQTVAKAPPIDSTKKTSSKAEGKDMGSAPPSSPLPSVLSIPSPDLSLTTSALLEDTPSFPVRETQNLLEEDAAPLSPFCELPDLALLRIADQLSLEEMSRLSRTCRSLWRVFQPLIGTRKKEIVLALWEMRTHYPDPMEYGSIQHNYDWLAQLPAEMVAPVIVGAADNNITIVDGHLRGSTKNKFTLSSAERDAIASKAEGDDIEHRQLFLTWAFEEKGSSFALTDEHAAGLFKRILCTSTWQEAHMYLNFWIGLLPPSAEDAYRKALTHIDRIVTEGTRIRKERAHPTKQLQRAMAELKKSYPEIYTPTTPPLPQLEPITSFLKKTIIAAEARCTAEDRRRNPCSCRARETDRQGENDMAPITDVPATKNGMLYLLAFLQYLVFEQHVSIFQTTFTIASFDSLKETVRQHTLYNYRISPRGIKDITFQPSAHYVACQLPWLIKMIRTPDVREVFAVM